MAELFNLTLGLKNLDCKVQSLKSSCWAVWLCQLCSASLQWAEAEALASGPGEAAVSRDWEQANSTMGNENQGKNPVKESKWLLLFYSRSKSQSFFYSVLPILMLGCCFVFCNFFHFVGWSLYLTFNAFSMQCVAPFSMQHREGKALQCNITSIDQANLICL